MKGNRVHTYCYGNSFPNIYSGDTGCPFGQIIHHTYMSPTEKQRWPWKKNQWSVSNHAFIHGYFKTLREAKAFALEKWPSCFFKTPSQFRREDR